MCTCAHGRARVYVVRVHRCAVGGEMRYIKEITYTVSTKHTHTHKHTNTADLAEDDDDERSELDLMRLPDPEKVARIEACLQGVLTILKYYTI